MPYQSLTIDRLYVVRWQVPALSDAQEVMSKIKQQHATSGQPVLWVILAPEDSKPPPEETRDFMVKNMLDVLRHCEVLHFVMEGQGFKSSIRRSVLTNILFLAGQRGRVQVHSTVDEALEKLPLREAQRQEVRRALRQAGMLERPPLS